MFKVGAIRKIHVENFITYNYVEMYPGPNLNMIIGPNGTGKSTIVAAIILGLGGTPKVVGRGNRVSEYIKHGCEVAKIHIYLQDRNENSFIKVSREFDRRDKSSWKLNGRPCLPNEIRDFIKQFNIQVDNLCQFLPQDRVVEFAKLNKQELLRETQLALCRTDLVDKQTSLIEARAKHKTLLEKMEKHTENLQETHEANSRMEGRVKNVAKRLKYKEKVDHIERKIAWLEYEGKRTVLNEIKQDKVQAQSVYDKYRNEIKPMENKIDEEKHNLTTMLSTNSKITQEIRTHECHINSTIEKIDGFTSIVRDVQDEINTKLAYNQEWDKQIDETAAKLEDMKNAYSQKIAKLKQESEQKEKVMSEIRDCSNNIKQCQEQRYKLQETHDYHKAELRALEHEQSRLENVKQLRLEQLRRMSSDTYTAVLWLGNNKHLFKGEIYEPIMMELNVLEDSKAKYVEAVVPFRDKMAFTCTNKADMNMMIQTLRCNQKLKINVVHSSASSGKFFQPIIPIERIRRYGFYAYVNSLFTAPDPIMKYLCETYKLHNIPIGDESTDSCYGDLPRELRIFFSKDYRYAISYSKYTNAKSSRQNVIKGDGAFSMTLDVIRLENCKGRYQVLNQKIENMETKLENCDSQISRLEDKAKLDKEKLMAICRREQEINSIKGRIAAARQSLEEMRKNKRDPADIRREAKGKLKKAIKSIGVQQEVLKNYFKQLSSIMTKSSVNSTKIEMLRLKIQYMENEIADSKRRIQDAQETLVLVTDRYNTVMQDAKEQLFKAKTLSNGFTPAHDGFDVFREVYNSLGDNIEQLNAEKDNLLARLGCLNTANDGEIREYEDRLALVEQLTESINTINSDMNKLTVKMDRIEKEWLTPLNELIFAINLRFASAFEKLGCAGQVTVCPGDDEKNYENYGISIKVTYRSGEPMQELNATVQSGGERAVATAAFMLALQESTPVPFRCVDEINQGMDASNERRIFELVAETTSKPDTSQYFLITPKLVPNLNYPERMLVHIVHNGPFVNPDQKFSASKWCNPEGVNIQ